MSEDKPKKKRVYKRKTKEPITDRDGMEAIAEPEIDEHRGDLDSKAVTMDIIPSVGPAVNDDFVIPKTKNAGINMQNTEPKKFPWQKPTEKKTAKPLLSGVISMSKLPPRKG